MHTLLGSTLAIAWADRVGNLAGNAVPLQAFAKNSESVLTCFKLLSMAEVGFRHCTGVNKMLDIFRLPSLCN